MTAFADRSVPPPDGIDDDIKDWILASNGANALHLQELTSELARLYTRRPWTPVLTFTTPGDLSVSYSTQWGEYTRVGRDVWLTAVIITSSFTFTTASGTLKVTGIPYTSYADTGSSWVGTLSMQGVTKAGYTDFDSNISASSDFVRILAAGSGATQATVTAADVPSGGTVVLELAIHYRF